MAGFMMPLMNKHNITLTQADRAVYSFVATGQCDATHAALYRRELSHLSRAGLVRKLDTGDYVAVASHAPSQPPPALPVVEVEPVERQVGISIRLPESWVEALDAAGPIRSDTLRKIIADALGEKFEPAPPVHSRRASERPSGFVRRAG